MSENIFSPERNEGEKEQINWESLDVQKISEQLQKYFKVSEKDKLELVKSKEEPDGNYQKRYQDKNGRVVRVEDKHVYISEEDHESSSELSEKEYDYNENGEVEKINYFISNDAERDQVMYSKSSVGEIKFEYNQGKITKAFIKDVSQVEADESAIKNTLEGKETFFYFEYDDDEIIKIIKEENKFGESKKESSVFYERNKEKETIFDRMSAIEIIEWELTRSNDLEGKTFSCFTIKKQYFPKT